MVKRRQLIPWRAAGTRAEMRRNADEVVRDTGWVFNNQTGDTLTLEEFVATGDAEVDIYLDRLGWSGISPQVTMLEIGSGIGRMTSAFTRRFDSTIATDVDAAFLERCRETVSRFGRPSALSTVHIEDGSSISVPDNSVDAVFSYITLQHCKASDALRLTSEAIRIVKPGGYVALNYRTWVPEDGLLVPAGVLMRQLWRIPVVGQRLSQWRWSTRLGWQANRLKPDTVLQLFESRLGEIKIFHSVKRKLAVAASREKNVQTIPTNRINPSHWWLVAQVS
jgi:ubiquinone/menaquinone biosynthesis C-methylase UbiE